MLRKTFISLIGKQRISLFSMARPPATLMTTRPIASNFGVRVTPMPTLSGENRFFSSESKKENRYERDDARQRVLNHLAKLRGREYVLKQIGSLDTELDKLENYPALQDLGRKYSDALKNDWIFMDGDDRGCKDNLLMHFE